MEIAKLHYRKSSALIKLKHYAWVIGDQVIGDGALDQSTRNINRAHTQDPHTRLTINVQLITNNPSRLPRRDLINNLKCALGFLAEIKAINIIHPEITRVKDDLTFDISSCQADAIRDINYTNRPLL